MALVEINHRDSLPLIEQIVQGVKQQVDNRALRIGSRVPSIRSFASDHGVSRFTVVQAYDRLVAAGYLASRQGSGFYVSKPTPEAVIDADPACDLDRAVDVLWLLRRAMQDDSHRYQPGCGWLPASWKDAGSLQRGLRQLSRGSTGQLVGYGRAAGYAPLRQDLQRRLGEAGIQADTRQIVTTHGISHALDLICRYLVRRDDVVLVDDPSYFNLFGMLRLLGARVIGVPRLADGPDTEALATLMAADRPRLMITSSILHNPTGSSISPATAYRMLQLADQHDMLIIDDDIYGDFHPNPPARLAALDQLKRVIYVSSFSKTISASLRVGYIACDPDLAQELLDLKLLTHLTSCEVSERLVHQVLVEGAYRKHMSRVQVRLDRAREQALSELERSGFRPFLEPEQGMFVWAEMPAGDMNAAELAHAALQYDMVLAPGNIFRPQPAASRWLRFNVAYCDAPEQFALIRRLLGR
ncbi:PLP-dependent aminotransferase family protein [Motiliproteus sediminis]|uniref:aminotransferase-like domain-containing protein n=1 Tax=Motiliproteus sediminis TaxID=1468178 RepID=UPI001AEF7E80|nr:PLP-dependent aminotransferase family protein [Motiliproteus sediminis]